MRKLRVWNDFAEGPTGPARRTRPRVAREGRVCCIRLGVWQIGGVGDSGKWGDLITVARKPGRGPRQRRLLRRLLQKAHYRPFSTLNILPDPIYTAEKYSIFNKVTVTGNRNHQLIEFYMKKLLCSITSIAFLAGCSGGSPSSNVIGGVVSAPTPTSTPTPAATPTPTATPTSSAVFRMAVGSPMVGSAVFDTNSSGVFLDSIVRNGVAEIDTTVSSNRNGEFGRDAPDRLSTATTPPAQLGTPAIVSGFSTASGYRYNDIVPNTSVAIWSPITTLISSIDVETVPSAFSIGLTARQLSQFDAAAAFASNDPAQADLGRRIVGINLKIAALAGFVRNSDPVIEFRPVQTLLREATERGPVNLSDRDTILRLINASSRGTVPGADDNRAAVAQLLSVFGQAVDRYLNSPARVADVEHAMRIAILPIANNLFNSIPATPQNLAAVRAVSVDDIQSLMSELASIPAPNIRSGTAIAVTDNLQIDPSGFREFTESLLIANDLVLLNGMIPSGPFNNQYRVNAVRIPSRFDGQIQLTNNGNGSYTVRPLTITERLVWLEYDIAFTEGATSSARIFFFPRGLFSAFVRP